MSGQHSVTLGDGAHLLGFHSSRGTSLVSAHVCEHWRAEWNTGTIEGLKIMVPAQAIGGRSNKEVDDAEHQLAMVSLSQSLPLSDSRCALSLPGSLSRAHSLRLFRPLSLNF